tara:strand:+ start:35 stop:535 length:501 start_codon:yes stop_codon:yes gene_type:complete
MAAIAAGVGAMLCIGSSVASVMMGGEETPAPAAGAGVGAGVGAGAGAGTEDTGSSMLKCIDTRKRDDMGWLSVGRVKTEAEARALCVATAEYLGRPVSNYMSLECPTADGFEVWCVDDISQADVLPDEECKGGVAEGPNDNAHCVGPYRWGDVNGGGAHRGSLYKI